MCATKSQFSAVLHPRVSTHFLTLNTEKELEAKIEDNEISKFQIISNYVKYDALHIGDDHKEKFREFLEDNYEDSILKQYKLFSLKISRKKRGICFRFRLVILQK